MILNVFTTSTKYEFEKSDGRKIRELFSETLKFYGRRFYMVDDPDQRHRKSRKAKVEPYVYYFFSDEYFPTGLIPTLFSRFRKSGIIIKPPKYYRENERQFDKDYVVVRNRLVHFKPQPLHEGGIIGKDLVLDFLKKEHNLTDEEVRRDLILEAFDIAMQKTRGILEISVGAGKTAFGAMIAAELGLDFLYIVPNKTLLEQTYDVFIRIFGEGLVGCIGGNSLELDKLITICLPHKLNNALKRDQKDPAINEFLQRQKAVYIDECHHVNINIFKRRGKVLLKGNMWYNIAMRLGNAKYRIGVSGTPFKENEIAQMFLKSATGNKLFSITSEKAWEEKYIMKPVVYFLRGVPTVQRFMFPKNVQAVYEEGILANQERNELIIRLANDYVKRGKSVLIVVERTEGHSARLKELIEAQQKELSKDFTYAVVIGTSNVRKPIFDKVNNKEIMVLISTVAREGVNIPNLDVLIQAGGLKSKVNILQKAGRVVRRKEEKQPIIIDFDDGGEMEWCNAQYLINHAQSRLAHYRSESYEIVEVSGEEWKAEGFVDGTT